MKIKKPRKFREKSKDKLQQYQADQTYPDGSPRDYYDPYHEQIIKPLDNPNIPNIAPVFKQHYIPNASTDTAYKECIFDVEMINAHNVSTLPFDPREEEERKTELDALHKNLAGTIITTINTIYEYPRRELVHLILQKYSNKQIIEIIFSAPEFEPIRNKGIYTKAGNKCELINHLNALRSTFAYTIQTELMKDPAFKKSFEKLNSIP